MNVRPAESEDRERIGAIARDSLQSSYSLSPAQIETILDEEFDDAALADLLDDTDSVVLVADDTVDGTDQVFGFVTVKVGAQAAILWLHVDPRARCDGIGTALVERVRDETGGKPLAAYILEDAVEGGTFLERFGLEQGDHDGILVGGEEFAVTLFTEGEGTETPNEPGVPVPESVPIDGVDRTVDRDDSVPGREAPFFRVYSTDDETEAYGFFCSACGSTDVSGDGLDRLNCGNCGNAHRADEWDDAYI